jgi:hypothetical protein
MDQFDALEGIEGPSEVSAVVQDVKWIEASVVGVARIDINGTTTIKH